MLSQILRSASGEIEIEPARRKRDESLMNAIGRKENKRFVRSAFLFVHQPSRCDRDDNGRHAAASKVKMHARKLVGGGRAECN